MQSGLICPGQRVDCVDPVKVAACRFYVGFLVVAVENSNATVFEPASELVDRGQVSRFPLVKLLEQQDDPCNSRG